MSNPVGGAEQTAPRCYRHPDRETWIACQRCGRPICPDCMNSAAVGFQCPSCVKEGAKSTRTAQRPYGGAVGGDPRTTSIALIIANAAVWLAITATGGSTSALIDKLAILPRGAVRVSQGSIAQIIPGVSDGAWWQVVTSAFTHVSVTHIGVNMLALWFLGPPVEAVLGRARFLAVYGVSLLAGSAAVMLFSAPNGQTLGASGAIFGLFGAFGVVTLKVGGDLRGIGMWLGLNLLITFTVPHISWEGHLGGLIGGALVTAVIVYAPRAHRGLVQWSGIGVLAALSIALIVGRAVALGPFDLLIR